jgi:ribonuclease III
MTGVSSSKGSDLAALQRKLGYEFQDPALLQAALTHKSHSRPNNERLEFIGDAVLGYLVGIMLYRHDHSLGEDMLSLMRAKLVRGSTLAEVARDIDLAPHLLLGSGERKSGGRQRSSILADAFEAVIGAVHEDGGIAACSTLVESLFKTRVNQLDPEDLKDAKTRLQELLQGLQLKLPEYAVAQVTGADHQRRYSVSCTIAELDVTVTATASSRRGAEQAAAAEALANTVLQAKNMQAKKGDRLKLSNE